MTSLPYIDPRPGYNEPAFLRVSNPRETGESIHFRVGLQKKTNSELRPKEANLLASSSALLFTAAGDLPPIPKASGKKRPTEASSPKPKPALIIERDEALVAEREAKRKLNTLRKALTRANTESVLQTIAAQKRRDVRQVRRAQEERTGSLLSKQFAKKVNPATAEEQNELGVLLLSAFAWVEPDPKARGWYKLYKHSKCRPYTRTSSPPANPLRSLPSSASLLTPPFASLLLAQWTSMGTAGSATTSSRR